MPALRSPTSGGRCGAVSACDRLCHPACCGFRRPGPALFPVPGSARPGSRRFPARPCPALPGRLLVPARPWLWPGPVPMGPLASGSGPRRFRPRLDRLRRRPETRRLGEEAGGAGREVCVGQGRPGSLPADSDLRRQPRPMPIRARNFGRPVTNLGKWGRGAERLARGRGGARGLETDSICAGVPGARTLGGGSCGLTHGLAPSCIPSPARIKTFFYFEIGSRPG